MLIDYEVMTHLAQFGSIKRMDPYAQHLLKTSEHPVMRFRRSWMRREALRQHLEAEHRQKKINDQFKDQQSPKGMSMRRAAVVDHHLSAEMLHYNKSATWNDKNFLGTVRQEAPAIFAK